MSGLRLLHTYSTQAQILDCFSRIEGTVERIVINDPSSSKGNAGKSQHPLTVHCCRMSWPKKVSWASFTHKLPALLAPFIFHAYFPNTISGSESLVLMMEVNKSM